VISKDNNCKCIGAFDANYFKKKKYIIIKNIWKERYISFHWKKNSWKKIQNFFQILKEKIVNISNTENNNGLFLENYFDWVNQKTISKKKK
jgi:hypothetical protein